MQEQLLETAIDQKKLYFHGSSEAKVDHLQAPSFKHPFYVTPDLHYAMAFCTKDDSQTGDYEDEEKIYTPASQNFVYCVSLKPTCKAFDFRDHSSTEFKKLYKVVDQELVEWVVKRNSRSFDMSDIFEFVAALQGSVVKLVDMSRANYLEYMKLFGAEPELMTPKLFLKACAFCKKNGLYETWGDFSVHQTMAPILEGLKKQGFHAILTRETDFNDEDPTKPSAKVSTSYALGIFDKAGIDLVSLVPMRYNWLKRINPTYLQDKTEASAREKIERFIKLYKRITTPKNIDESQLEAEEQWYFGNNRSKNLKISNPSWNAPFFLTTSYEYAKDYSDYGVYKIELIDYRDLNILDFNNEEEVQKLGWPEVLVDKILEGRSDLNSLAYDLYILANGSTDDLMHIENTDEWLDAAIWFQDRSEDIFKLVRSKGIWGSEKDHQFLLQMWKDIYDAGFAGFTHQEFGHKILALFDLKCIDKISVNPISMALDEKQKNRALKKAFKAKGQAAFPKINSDGDIVFVSDIPKDKALQLLKRACHDVSNFHPEYMEKAVKWSDDQIFGAFNKHDKRNVLAMASVSFNGDESGAAYLHEMTGFIKGGYGKKLVMQLLQKFKKVYGQIALEGSGTKDDPYRPNEKLRDKFYATIPGVKIYRVENSVWNCPADFFYYGISDGSIKEFFEKTYGSKESLNEDMQNSNLNASINDVLSAYKQKFGFDLSYMKFKVDGQPVYTNGQPCYEYDEDECAGDWTSLGWIRLNPDMKSVMDRYGIAWHGIDDIDEFTKIIIAHELAYEVWNKIADDQFKNEVLTKARSQNFTTEYLQTVKPSKLDEETFCEYLSHEVVQQDHMQYEPPYSLEQIKAKYPEHIYSKLANDPVHKWRAESGIELIHKEPTDEELDRIWKNWQLMPQEMKDISDKKSIELFGCTNAEHYNKLKASEDHLNENKATYLQKYRDESDVRSIVDMFWSIRNRLSAPYNDIDWWIKKPFNDLKSFVQNFDTSNKKERRQFNYKQNAIDNGAKLLDTKDGYEIWYVPTYDAMRILGRFYKGRSAKWCVASDDPDFWFDNHEDSEFVVLVKEHPKNDEFDKVAIEMMNHGRYYNEDDIIPWDLDNEDWTFTNDELMHEAWMLFKDNDETREQYFG